MLAVTSALLRMRSRFRHNPVLIDLKERGRSRLWLKTIVLTRLDLSLEVLKYFHVVSAGWQGYRLVELLMLTLRCRGPIVIDVAAIAIAVVRVSIISRYLKVSVRSSAGGAGIGIVGAAAGRRSDRKGGRGHWTTWGCWLFGGSWYKKRTGGILCKCCDCSFSGWKLASSSFFLSVLTCSHAAPALFGGPWSDK